MPLFLPHVRLLQFYVFRGIHSTRAYHHSQPGFGENASNAGLSPFIAPLEHDQWFNAGRHWSDRTDFARFPHLLRFGSAAELLGALAPGATDWNAVSLGMKRFNEDGLVLSANHWANGVAAAMAGSAGVSRGVAESRSDTDKSGEKVAIPTEWRHALSVGVAEAAKA